MRKVREGPDCWMVRAEQTLDPTGHVFPNALPPTAIRQWRFSTTTLTPTAHMVRLVSWQESKQRSTNLKTAAHLAKLLDRAQRATSID